MEEPVSFEKAINRLEEIVETMEKGDIPLEQALELYQEGQVLLKSCQNKLAEAEKKLKILTEDSSGKAILKDFPETENQSEKE
jgi:exodeoxyribonuclease VII small subunit